ncbi:hypothetical protein [Naasia aerilata]|uniref:Uncharacterized protein n=1 Tax=Naasia aerilata TaxID=1162966 RepID=A0ABN6XSJ2_9MICO|nr:hypothetical protein [Naasia aerilata]BDZ46575.1 hypothetical protein GCM10025866_24840 [Naasia aerilata]
MSLFHAVVLAAAETEHPLPMPPVGFGLTAIAVFAALGIVAWSYRNVANRHSQVSGQRGGDGSGHGTSHDG